MQYNFRVLFFSLYVNFESGISSSLGSVGGNKHFEHSGLKLNHDASDCSPQSME